MKLTESQVKTLRAIISFIRNKGFAPTIQELINLTGFKSKSTIHYHIKALEMYGYITMDATKSRTIKPDFEFIRQEGLENL